MLIVRRWLRRAARTTPEMARSGADAGRLAGNFRDSPKFPSKINGRHGGFVHS